MGAHDRDRRLLAVDADPVGERDQRRAVDHLDLERRVVTRPIGRPLAPLGADAEPQQQVGDIGGQAIGCRRIPDPAASEARHPRGRVACEQPVQEPGHPVGRETEDGRGNPRTGSVGIDTARQHVDVVVGELVVTEHGETGRYGDDLTDPDRFEGAPAPRGQQWMRRGDRHLATGTGSYPEHRLHAIVETRRRDRTRLATLGVERQHVETATSRGAVHQFGGGDHLAGRHVDHRRVPCDALPHRGSGPHDVERARLEPRQQLVDVGVAGGDAGDRVAAIERLLEAVHRLRQQVVELANRVGDPLLGNREHLGLGLVERLGDVVGLAVGELGDVARHIDQAAQHRRVLDDLGVVAGARDGGRRVLQLVHRLRATDLFEQPAAAQLVGDGDRVDRAAARVQGADRVEDVLMGRAVEVGRIQPLLADDANRLT